MASSARLDELKKKFDENPRRYFAPLANEHRKSGDLDQAIALCRTHLPLQPGHISGHIVLAQALFETGSLDESREIFHTALGLDPENLIALRYLGDIAKQASDIETARQWYQRVLEVDPRNDEIVQLVRDLDAPPQAQPAEPSLDFPTAAAPATTAASYAPPPPPRAHVENDARFAPLSLDELDVDASPTTSPDETAAVTPEDASVDWVARAETADLSMLDTPEIDPFDLDPAGSVDALLDATPPPAEDFFLTELTGSNAPTDGSESHAIASDASEGAASYASATPQVAPSTPEVEPDFEEGSFYLEPPPPEPVSSSAEPEAAAPVPHAEPTDLVAEREQVSMPGLDAFVAEYSVPDEDLHATAAASEWIAPAPEPAPNADALALFAEQQTAEWQPPVSEPTPPAVHAMDDGLGLEVMEFVPPSRESSPPAPSRMPTTDADPLIGRTLESVSADHSDTPAAFVTETMAELYLQQGFRNEALAVYRELLARNPADANLRDRVEQIESGSLSSIGMAAVSENVVESARKRQTARPTRSVRSFFASLAGRRVAAPRETIDVPEADIVGELDQSAPETSYGTVPEAAADAAVPATFDATTAAEPERPTPNASAAETLAEFDPFADAYEPAPAPVEPVTETPNAVASAPSEEPIDQLAATDLSAWAAPTAEMPVAPAEPATPPSDTSHGHRSLEDLFPETPVTERTEAAAQTFATAFGRAEPQGRPTRAASNELSLDHVFRGAPEGAPQADGGFSFDQFFSDSRSSGDATAAAATTPDAGRGNGSGDAHDIEQFTAWLEGLKKK